MRYSSYSASKKIRGLVMFLYILFALYFLNYPFGVIVIPELFSSVEPWIIFIGGILLIIGGFSYFKRGRMHY